MSPTEEWRTIASHPDYQVSAAGQVRRVAPRFRHPTMGILKPRVDGSTGYQKVKLDGATRPVHVLVCEARSRD